MEKELSEEILGCCACEDKPEGNYSGLTCEDKKTIFTRKELEVLGRIRESSVRASALRAEINRKDEPGRQTARLELHNLRLMRAQLEKERLAARDERMRILGHL